jgi:peptidoglycan/LPS O-acetylase OafA/YrhL
MAGVCGSNYRMFGAYRFGLAITVVVGHSWTLTFGDRTVFVAEIGMGNVAVMGFFVLSGFIISEAVDIFYVNRPGAFLLNRALRLLPPYWLAVVVSIVIHVTLSSMGILKLQDYVIPPPDMFSAQNLLIQVTNIIPILNFNKIFASGQEWYPFVRFAWAVLVEFIFYFAFFLAMVAWPAARRFCSLRTYLILCAVGALGIHIVHGYLQPLHSSLSFTPYFVLGCSMYVAMTRRDRVAVLIAAASYAFVLLHFSRYTQGNVPISREYWSGLSRPAVLTPLVSMAAVPMLLFGLAEWQAALRTVRVDKFLGDLTYPIYLNQYSIIIIALSVTHTPSWIIQTATVMAVLAVGWIMKAVVEAPVASLRTAIRGAPLLTMPAIASPGLPRTRSAG